MEQRIYTEKAIEILDAAERHMRHGGFDAVSFRDLAAEVGIKSASVHYHFPQKADLGKAVVERYATRVLGFLGRPDDPSETVGTRIGRLCDAYRHALLGEGLACLCCVLGAEFRDLPSPVAEAVSGFFDTILQWTETALDADTTGTKPDGQNAAHIVSSLQGAMILAMSTGRTEHLTEVTDHILDSLNPDDGT